MRSSGNLRLDVPCGASTRVTMNRIDMDHISDGPAQARCVDVAHYMASSLKEKIIDHLFVGGLLRVLWRAGRRRVEVLRAEVDCAGYDLMVETDGIARHIQLKSSYRGAKTAVVPINMSLAQKPSGCVLWVQFDPKTLDLGPFHWFGGAPGEPLPPLG